MPAFTDEDAISVYSAITGYDPSDPSTTGARTRRTAMRYWEHPGLKTSDGETSTRSSRPWRSIPATSTSAGSRSTSSSTCRSASRCRSPHRGRQEWTVVGDGKTGNSAPGSWGGHGIPYREYDARDLQVRDVGRRACCSRVPFHQDYAQEAHVVVTKEMLNKQGVGPSGVAWDELIADIKALHRLPGCG